MSVNASSTVAPASGGVAGAVTAGHTVSSRNAPSSARAIARLMLVWPQSRTANVAPDLPAVPTAARAAPRDVLGVQERRDRVTSEQLECLPTANRRRNGGPVGDADVVERGLLRQLADVHPPIMAQPPPAKCRSRARLYNHRDRHFAGQRRDVSPSASAAVVRTARWSSTVARPARMVLTDTWVAPASRQRPTWSTSLSAPPSPQLTRPSLPTAVGSRPASFAACSATARASSSF